jgi:hypothetical protein
VIIFIQAILFYFLWGGSVMAVFFCPVVDVLNRSAPIMLQTHRRRSARLAISSWNAL